LKNFIKIEEGIVPLVASSREHLCLGAKTLSTLPQTLTQTCEHSQR
jgi:hypothetical protein